MNFWRASQSEIKRKESQMRDGDLSGIFQQFTDILDSRFETCGQYDLHIMHTAQLNAKMYQFHRFFPQKFSNSLRTSIPFHRF